MILFVYVYVRWLSFFIFYLSLKSTYSLLSNRLIKLMVEGVALCLELIILVCEVSLDGEHSFAR